MDCGLGVVDNIFSSSPVFGLSTQPNATLVAPKTLAYAAYESDCLINFSCTVLNLVDFPRKKYQNCSVCSIYTSNNHTKEVVILIKI
jgi:hypothetical protein